MQRPSLRFLVGLAGVGSLASALVVAGCVEHEVWTSPYEELGDDANTMVVGGEQVRVMGLPGEENEARSAGCISCHEGAVDPHPRPVNISCVDCHGGDGLATTVEEGHPAARHPDEWPGSGNPERTYALLNDESYDWIRFVNPGDLRVLRDTCGRCHGKETLQVQKSMMTNASHFWGVAAYANGIVSSKSSIFGESYSPEGIAQAVFTVPAPTDEEQARSVIPFVVPLPHFEVGQTGNVFRVFEQGSRLGGAAIGLAGAPVPIVGIPDKLEDPGRPNNRLSDRGLGTLNRVDLPLLNIFKTRLNDPLLSFLGTNDQPGDFRSAGCTACHMVYANDRDPMHSGPYARYGHQGLGNVDEDPWGEAVVADPTIPKDEPGHPLMHRFTRAIPSSQCMVCHHHQPNSFVNSYFGFTMWSYDADGEPLWPEEQQYPSNHEWFERIARNPEGAAVTGKWGEREFLDRSAELNPELQHTQFADYHGHGWMFRGAFKMDRKGNLLDRDGNVVDYDDPDKFRGVLPELGSDPTAEEIDEGVFAPREGRAVHLRDVHAERGMHCVDCHFERDVHGDTKLYAEYQAAIEITCQDCHGTLAEVADGYTSGPSTGSSRSAEGTLDEGEHRTSLLRGETPFGQARLRWERDEAGVDVLRQRSMLYSGLEWDVPQVAETTKGNPRAAAAHGEPAHGDGKLDCYACHSSWITACFGCHLPQKANWRTEVNHFERKKLRNYATYNPQVVRDAEFMLGVAGNVKGNRIAPVRSSSAVVISSEDGLRRRIYGGVPTIAANGMSSQVFNTHFPHTVRTTETRRCEDCHVSKENDNNAWLAQVLLLGTKQVGYMGHNVFVGEGEEGFEAVRVTEWEEPQAVIGSHLQEMAYPDHYDAFVAGGRVLSEAEHHGGTEIMSLQLRGEYLYAASGVGGFRVYDVANVNNKDFSEKLVTSPVSPLGQDTHVETRYATAVALPSNNHISMSRKWRPENREQPYEYRGRTQNMHELYRYSYVTDLHEGLIVVDTDCLTDFDPRNNFIRRAATFNPDGVLDGAVDVTLAGTVAYVCCDRGVVLVDLDDPLEPRVMGTIGEPHVVDPTALAIQFRYAFVADAEGLKVLDVTLPEEAHPVAGATLEIAGARDVFVAKTWAYVSAGSQGLVIVDVERPEEPAIARVFDAGGVIDDLYATRVATTNDTVFAYLADGRNGLRVLKLIAPNDGGRSAFGFSPAPVPELIATYPTHGAAIALSEALDRDRAVDETGNQVAVFGRIGGRPMNLAEMRRLYLVDGRIYPVSNEEDGTAEGDE